MNFNMNDIIYKKREGGELTADEIKWWINGYVKGDIPDYQVSALLMAIFFRGLFFRRCRFSNRSPSFLIIRTRRKN